MDIIIKNAISCWRRNQLEEIEYVMANNTATLVWLANLAAIELHSMTIRATNFLPDVFIFDLDPPEGIDFEEIKKIAWELKLFLEVKGYHPFLKTSGSKGLHIYVPIFPEYTTEQVVENAKSLSREFIITHPNTTLLVSKERRTNKILIDIYRNHRSQTCASAYSVRGKEGAPVSCPIAWEDFESLKSSQQYNIRNIFEYLNKRGGDRWRQLNSPETSVALIPGGEIYSELIPNIKTKSEDLNSELTNVIINTPTNQASLLGAGGLFSYSQKRNFEKTSEPIPDITQNTSGELRYVIQKHDASNLHYDLRLESDGVLLSWAIPKALPTIPGEKRMAIQTEPHPMKYIDFEGIIPKDEYGGGEMWIFDTGILNYIKKEENKIRFVLSKGKIIGEFYIYKTDVWALSRWRNARAVELGEVPPISIRSIEKEPSAELRPEQKDSDSLPDYTILDEVLTEYVDHDRGYDALVAAGFDSALVARVLGLVDMAEYKRRQYPPGTKVSSRAFGKDRRLPMTTRWREGK